MVKLSSIPNKFNPNDEKNLIKVYNEETDEESYIPIDNELLEFLKSKQIYLKKKLGQGGYNAAFETIEKNVVLIPGLFTDEVYNTIRCDQLSETI